MFEFQIAYALLALAALGAFAVIFVWPNNSDDPIKKL
jgi:hypothetical protein